MSRKPGLMLISGNSPALLFDQAWSVQSTASYLIRFSGPLEDKMRTMMAVPKNVLSVAHGLHIRTGTEIYYNRDVDPILASQVLKNPSLDRCRHLSLSFWKGHASNDNPQHEVRGELYRAKLEDETIRTRWLESFFGNDLRKLWVCDPIDEEGRRFDIKHYRLFSDECWLPLPAIVGIAKSPLHALGWHLWGEPEQTLPKEMALPANQGLVDAKNERRTEN